MKILQIHNFYQKTGGEDVVVEVEKKLLEEKGNVVISLFAYNSDITNIFFARRNFFSELERTIDENPDIDLAHIHNIFSIIGPNIYPFLAKRKIKIVQTIHNFRFLCPNGLFFDNKGKICELCKKGDFINAVVKKCYHKSYILSFLMQHNVAKARKYAMNTVSSFIALSNFTKNKLIKSGFDPENIFVKPNFLYPQPPKVSLNDGGYALFIGRLSAEKGLHTLIRAFKMTNFKLKIAGTGDLLEELMNLAHGYPNIEFLGFVSGKEKDVVVENASFIIIPSMQYENFPVSILDSFSRGKTVIATRIGSIPEIVKDEYSGRLFELNNSEDLLKSLNWMLEDYKYKELGKHAYTEFLEKYQTEQNYSQLLKIYGHATNK